MKKRALVSVYDKSGIVSFSKKLVELGFEIISTGGTYNLLKKENINVISVEDVTGFPEILNGRVKTLHPRISGGILADISNPLHIDEIKSKGIYPVCLVVVNLYPFEETIKKGNATLEDAIEQIDIGGVTLIRAAAKNFKCVNLLTNPGQYDEYIKTMKSENGIIPKEYSLKLAAEGFSLTSNYDRLISSYLDSINAGNEISINEFPGFEKYEKQNLRYGENPHQKAVLLKENFNGIFEVLHGKELSYNNLLDMEAAYNLISEFENDSPACAIIKHGNPCGAAVSDSLQSAYAKAFETDTQSPFGGIIIFNKKLDFKTSIDIDKLFSEIVLAPDFDEEALEILRKKKNRRLVKFVFFKENFEFRKISGGVLYQEKDNLKTSRDSLKFVTKKRADDMQIDDMLFAFVIAKHTKSNAIVFAKEKKTLAIGGGQPSRIDSTRIAVNKARTFGHDLKGSAAASDAFFPFADGLIEIADAGAVCIIQPGGSVRDEEVIEEANKRNLAMAFTGVRHFRH